jgi:predicted DNA-binding transcriptional regulator YafY
MGITLQRQWMIIAYLPKPPRKIDTAVLEARLREDGFEATRRTIQRDLVELSRVFPIVADDRDKPYGWRWSEDAEFLCTVPAAPGVDASAEPMDVKLRVRRPALRAILERLRARACTTSDESDRHVIVRATVDDHCAIRRMLMGHADEVEVVEPVALRHEIALRLRRALDTHSR